jgi:hypothetical protein
MQQRKHRPLAARTLNRPRHTGEKQWPNELVRPRKSLTEEPDDLSGKRPTKLAWDKEIEEDFSPGGKHEKALEKIDAEIRAENCTPLA